MNSNSDTADQKIASLERELLGVQEILAFTLHTIGEPVVVYKEALSRGLPQGTQIKIDEDLATEAFVLSLDIPNE